MQNHNKQQLVRILLIQAEHFIPTDGQIWNSTNRVHLKLYWEDYVMLCCTVFD